MPTLFKLLAATAVVAGIVWGGMYWLANNVQPVERDIVIRIPSEKLGPKP